MTREGAARGQVTVAAILILLILSILTPAIVYMVQHETRWTLKQKRSTVAFYLAEGGADRAVWKLKENSTNFDAVLNGGSLAGYNNDVNYTDVTGGVYRIVMTSTTVKREIRVVSTGKDMSANEHRAIEVLLKKEGANGAIQAPSVQVSGSAVIHWGPAMSLTNLNLTGSANQLFPRKLARGSITASGGYPSRDTSSSAPNTDGIEWWSYNEPPGVPNTPSVNLSSYTERAKADCGCVPAGTITPACAGGSCYYAANPGTLSGLVDTNESRVRVFESFYEIHFSGSKHFRGILIVLGDLKMTGSGNSGTGIYDATVPVEAWKEYQKNSLAGGDTCTGGDTSGGGGFGAADDLNYRNNADAEGDKTCRHQYPGDEGYHLVASTFNFTAGCSHGNMGGASGEAMSFKGYIQVQGNTHMAGSVSVHGAFVSISGLFSGVGSLNVWYDDSISLEVTGVTFTQTSWKEVGPVPF